MSRVSSFSEPGYESLDAGVTEFWQAYQADDLSMCQSIRAELDNDGRWTDRQIDAAIANAMPLTVLSSIPVFSNKGP